MVPRAGPPGGGVVRCERGRLVRGQLGKDLKARLRNDALVNLTMSPKVH